ncbi:MAG TPA: hypothetical protein VJ717_07380 [Gemmatimonadaceae bacterium]|nr:hypothetical protein [Gemmatimonadaceae bacterium]
MTLVTIVGMLSGVLLLLTAIYIFLSKKAFPAGGVAVTLVSLVMIGMSQWSTIRIKGGGIDIDLTTLAAAVDTLAAQGVITANAIDSTRRGLVKLTDQLGDRNVLPRPSINSVLEPLRAAPRIDTAALNRNRTRVGRIRE